jgi:signal transduction histidine kinase
MSIRLKLTLLCSFLTLALLIGIGTLFLINLRSGLQTNLKSSLRTQVAEVSAQVQTTGTGAAEQLRVANGSFAQVLDTSGHIVLSTDNISGQPLISAAQARQAASDSFGFNATVHPNATSATHNPSPVHVRVYATGAGQPGQVIAVAISREVVDDAMARARDELFIVGAIVLLLAGPGAWLVTRAALKPVERMRAQAAELQARDAGAGLPVPGTRDEIARLGATLNELLARLHGAVEHERAFVADAGHELRTPLTVLRGELELARRPGRSPDQLLETIDIAAEETERLVRLAEDLLVLARDEQTLPIRRQSFDVVALIDAARSAALISTTNPVDITISGPDELTAIGDPDRIRQAVDNLLSNAVRYSPDDGTIRIDLLSDDGEIEIAVLDRGPGFDPDFIPHAFERFRRGDPARRRGTSATGGGGGTGLGLAIVRSILRAHEGVAVAANRTDGPGSRVSVRWPGQPLAARRGQLTVVRPERPAAS